MGSLKWTTSDAVFITEIDDEHKEIFAVLREFQAALGNPRSDLRPLTARLTEQVAGHFAHEERLMRAARYGSLQWHKQLHDAARHRVRQLVARVEQGDTKTGPTLVTYLTGWLRNHAHIADRMMGAALRNHQRGMFRLNLRASTRPVDSCLWTDAHGQPFRPELPGTHS